MKFYIVLLFISFNVISSEDYSIDEFLGEIQNNGVYNLLQSLMDFFGGDVAKETCFQIYNSNNCDQTVNSYLTSNSYARDYVHLDSDYSNTSKIEEETTTNTEKLISLIKEFDGPPNIRAKLIFNVYKSKNKFKEIFNN